jgi:hypothetical protein
VFPTEFRVAGIKPGSLQPACRRAETARKKKPGRSGRDDNLLPFASRPKLLGLVDGAPADYSAKDPGFEVVGRREFG